MTDEQRTPAWRQCVCCAEATKTGLETRVMWCDIGMVCLAKQIRKSEIMSADVSLAFTQELYCYATCHCLPSSGNETEITSRASQYKCPWSGKHPLLGVGASWYQFERTDQKHARYAPMHFPKTCTYSLMAIICDLWCNHMYHDGWKVC